MARTSPRPARLNRGWTNHMSDFSLAYLPVFAVRRSRFLAEDPHENLYCATATVVIGTDSPIAALANCLRLVRFDGGDPPYFPACRIPP